MYTLTKMAAKRSKARSGAKIDPDDAGARLVVNLPEQVHRAIKIRAIERGLTIRQYIVGLLKADGVSVD